MNGQSADSKKIHEVLKSPQVNRADELVSKTPWFETMVMDATTKSVVSQSDSKDASTSKRPSPPSLAPFRASQPTQPKPTELPKPPATQQARVAQAVPPVAVSFPVTQSGLLQPSPPPDVPPPPSRPPRVKVEFSQLPKAKVMRDGPSKAHPIGNQRLGGPNVTIRQYLQDKDRKDIKVKLETNVHQQIERLQERVGIDRMLEDRLCLAMHLLQIPAYLSIYWSFGSLSVIMIVPIAIWVLYKNQSSKVDEHGRFVFNLLLTFCLYAVVQAAVKLTGLLMPSLGDLSVGLVHVGNFFMTLYTCLLALVGVYWTYTSIPTNPRLCLEMISRSVSE